MLLFVISASCGVGKSTMKDELAKRESLSSFSFIDSDEVGLNWWDYAGTDHEKKYGEDSLKRAVEMAKGRHLVFSSCLNPLDYFRDMDAPEAVDASFFIAMVCDDGMQYDRLRARPAERGFTSDEVIRPHIEYNRWFRKQRSKFQLFIDNTDQSVEETADIIERYLTDTAGVYKGVNNGKI